MKARRLPSVRGGELPTGHRAEDVVQEAITQAWDGGRSWNTGAYSTVEDFLRAAIDSLISNLVTQAEHKRRKNPPPDWRPPPDSASSALDVLANAECFEALAYAVHEITADDPQLTTVAKGLLMGKTPGEIASELSIGDQIYNLTRKLYRRLRTALAQHPCWDDQSDR